MEKVYCYNCNKDVIPNEIIKKNEYTVHKKNVLVEEKIIICPICMSELINENLNDSLYLIYNEYLKTYGLSFEKLKDIRKSYNLSQELFGRALNWGKRTITRYENAESLPQPQYLSIYKRIENNKIEFLNILKNNKTNMDDKTYYKIYDSVNSNLDLKTINTFLYVLRDNYLTRTQIMKNMSAIDFESYKKNNCSITKLNYAHGIYGPIIDKKDACLNLLIMQNYIELVNDEEDNILFKPKQDCDLNLFSLDEIKVMNFVLKKLKGKSSSELTNWSHKFKGWLKTKPGEKIDYSYSKYFELNNL